MDPITAVSTLGAVIGIIDVITKSISGLREISARYKDAEFTIAALVSQLMVLRAALTTIREWMDSEPAESHYQLVMDLGDALSFCGILTDKLEAEVLRCNRSTRGLLKARSKLKFAVGGRSMEDLQNMVLHQTNALNLAIAACNLCGTPNAHIYLRSYACF
jgi:guanine nucleotide-binding protein subunit alpha